MPRGPWGYGMDECMEWARRNRDVDDVGAYCADIERRQEDAKKSSSPNLYLFSDDELVTFSKSLAEGKLTDGTIDRYIDIYHEMNDRGMTPDFGPVEPEVEFWVKNYPIHRDMVYMEKAWEYFPQEISAKSINVFISGEGAVRDWIGKNGTIDLVIASMDIEDAIENEILAKVECPGVRHRLTFTWGVDPEESMVPLYAGGKKVPLPYGKVEKAVWTTAFINDLPDSAFAYVEPGEKDEGGKTVPRSKRHLPYKDGSGKVDPDHVRNALSRLPQTHIPDEAKESARKKLVGAAKKVGIEVSDKACVSGRYAIVDSTWAELEKVEKSLVPKMVEGGETLLYVKMVGGPRVWKVGKEFAVYVGVSDEASMDAEGSAEDEKFLLKKKKRVQSGSVPIWGGRENRCEVVEFDGWVLRQNEPLGVEYTLTRSAEAYPFVVQKHAWMDAGNYDICINRGDFVEVLTSEVNPLEGKGEIPVLRKEVGDTTIMKRDGKWKSGSTMVTTSSVMDGMMTVDDEGTWTFSGFSGKDCGISINYDPDRGCIIYK